MPIMKCTIGGKSGFKFGSSGKCYTGPGARGKAAIQGKAIKSDNTFEESVIKIITGTGRSDGLSDFEILVQSRRESVKNRTPPKRLPRWLYPLPVAKFYDNRLQDYLDEIDKIVNTSLIPHIPDLVEQRNAEIPEAARTDDWSDDGERLVNTVRIGIDNLPVNKTLLAANIGDKTNAWNDKEWKKILNAAFGVDIYQREPWLNAELKSFTKENVSLITKMENDLLDDIGSTLQRDLRAGKTSKSIADDIQKRVDVTRSRATLIARDQVGKFNGQLTELRQTNAGVKEYIWRTADDERVRKNHRSKDDRKFKWNDPPSDTGHPGQDIQCRCWAEPIFDELFKELKLTTKPGLLAIKPDTERIKLLEEFTGQYPGKTRTSDFLVMADIMRRKGFVSTIARSSNKIVGTAAVNKLRRTMFIEGIGAIVRHNTVLAKLTSNILRQAKNSGLAVTLSNTIQNSKLFKQFGFVLKDKRLHASLSILDDILKNIQKYLSERKSMRVSMESIE